MRGTLRKLAIFMSVILAILLSLGGFTLAAISPVQITYDPSNQGRPDVAGDVIVWKDNRNANWDIYMYPLPEGPETAVELDPAYQNLPVTNGSVIVWQDNRSGDNDLWMKEIDGGDPALLVGGPGHQMLPEISGNMVVFVDNQGAGSNTDSSNDIHMIDITSGIRESICSCPGSQWQPRISGDRVVWQDNRSGQWDIYSRKLGGPEEIVSGEPGSHTVADVDGDMVVWRDLRDGRYDIWMKDLSGTEPAVPVTSDAAYQTNPRISGDLVVWEDFRNDQDPEDAYYDYDIYMKDLTSGQESGLATGPMIQAKPAIDREKVVWEASNHPISDYNIWMAHVPDLFAPEVASFSPADGSGPVCAAPRVSARYSDNRAGIDPASVRLTLDGEDVTGESTVTEEEVAYQPASMAEGEHVASLVVADFAGNTTSVSWRFETGNPIAGLNLDGVFWASMADYEMGELSLELSMSNSSAEMPINGLEILAAAPTAGVVLASQTPVHVGDILPGASANAILKFRVPPGVLSFKTTIYAGCSDGCSEYFYFPGPPPGS